MRLVSHQVYLALGTNMGDRLSNLRKALLSFPKSVKVIQTSPVYETLPWGYIDQPAFLNMVACLKTTLKPEKLLKVLKRIEQRMGREPTFRYGPRCIDLDIILYDNLIMDSPGLTIPHPRFHERAFVLVPLVNLAPDLVHPVLNVPISELLHSLDCSGITLFRSAIFDVT